MIMNQLTIFLLLFLIASTSNAQVHFSGTLDEYSDIERYGNITIGYTIPYAAVKLKVFQYAQVGWNGAAAVWGEMYTPAGVNPTDMSGIKGISNAGNGVYGVSTSGRGVYAESTSGYAGYFVGKTYFSTKVGIGTTAPLSYLQVGNDGLKLNFGSANGVLVKIGTTTNNITGYMGFNLVKGTGTNWDYEATGSKNGGSLIFSNDNGDIYFAAIGSSGNTAGSITDDVLIDKSRFRIFSNGKVLVGSPPSQNVTACVLSSPYTMFVKGGIRTEEVMVETGWCDYVFSPSYHLLSLEEVKQHIAEKGYLHHTPSAAEIAENGNKLGETTLQHQEKIEEIYLHLIQLNERVKQLEAENQVLKSHSKQ